MKVIQCLFILVLCVGYAVSSNKWDILVYTQQWPLTSCMNWIHSNSSHSCFLPKNNLAWTVHGIWPTKYGTTGPGFCNSTWTFDPVEIKPIEEKLIQNWANVEKGTETYSFWAHEWNKHGTCAASLEALNTQFKYFSQGLNWLKQYTMNDILIASGILPSQERKYTVKEIYEAIKYKLDVNPMIECRSENGVQHLLELRICLNRDMTLINCDGAIGSYPTRDGIITNCNENSGIIYPENLDEYDSVRETKNGALFMNLWYLLSWIQWMTL